MDFQTFKRLITMTLEEFLQQDFELQQRIHDYRMDSLQKQTDISLNEQEIQRLQQQRIELRHQIDKKEDEL